MARTPSMYVPLDMNYLRDPRIRKAGPDAELLFIRSLAHSKAGGTDGFIGDYDLDVVAVGLKAVPARVRALVREGLWVEVDGGWQIRSWAKWNMTLAEIASDKEIKREAAIKTNHDRWHKDKTDPNCAHCNGSHERVATPIATPIASGSLREVKRSEREEKGREGKLLGLGRAVWDGPDSSSSSPKVMREETA